MADRVLGEEEQNLLYEKFEQHEENVIGQGVHDKLHSMIDIWGGIWCGIRHTKLNINAIKERKMSNESKN